MKHAKTITFSALGCVVIGLPVAFLQKPATIRPNTYVGQVSVGGLTPEQARFRLRSWWETERLKPVPLTSDVVSNLPELTPSKFGIVLDDEATVAPLPLSDLVTDGKAFAGQLPEERIDAKLVFKAEGKIDTSLYEAVVQASPEPEPARVTYSKGAILVRKERANLVLDAAKLQKAVQEMLPKLEPTPVPIIEGKKRVPDEELAKVKEVVSEYTTRFSAGNRPRSSNIELAASFFNGQVLMPGEKLSYNDTVGRRTIKRGFKVAGVYINGKHDTGVGGGICQVSTTLYNAALFANLGIPQRQNHSLAVPYVPLGRDATVDFGNIDLVLQNTTEAPIAVVSTYTPGALTFRILGQKVPGQQVTVSQGRVSTRTRGVRTVVDRNLAAGARRVVEGGAPARVVSAFRTVRVNGQVVKSENLGTSYYGGSPRVVVVGARSSSSL